MYIFIGLAMLIVLTNVIYLIMSFKRYEDEEMQNSLSARDYWRWKNGGID